ncbi:hypothetical protein ADIS_0657 [Lunatimonas lonarensis]|uniref:Uncharacterized protein n=1 Tax=Lunatimonas lonarensis TaxID=1232681 RepID=R7ZX63_9BACT|nr:hypothetical protein ADIS_0657 [Lunatimonas lonarensis]
MSKIVWVGICQKMVGLGWRVRNYRGKLVNLAQNICRLLPVYAHWNLKHLKKLLDNSYE